MRITDFCIWEDVKNEYIQYRKDGKTRDDAVMCLMEDYFAELTQGAADDGLLFWVGLADGQYYRKELSKEVAQKATEAIKVLSSYGWNLCSGDLTRRLEKYKEAPMSEKKVGKPRPKFRCSWAIGDVYAYRLSGSRAEQEGVAGKYALLRKVAEEDGWDGRSFPVVTVTMWDKPPFPENAEEFCAVPLMVVCLGGRMGSPRHHFEYRAEMIVDSNKQFQSMGFEYVGNFPDTPMPQDEIVHRLPGETCMFLLKNLDEDISRSCYFTRVYKNNN